MPDASPRVLVIGGYGFIGAAVARALADAGAEVCIAGRDAAAAARVLPGWAFQNLDLSDMQSADSWKKILQSRTLVVNCAGAPSACRRQCPHRPGDPRIIAHTAGMVVPTDTVFAAAADNIGGRDLAKEMTRLHPGVPVAPLSRTDASGIDSGKAEALFGWSPRRSWRNYLDDKGNPLAAEATS